MSSIDVRPESGIVVPSPPGPDGKPRAVTVASQVAGRADLVLEGGGVKGLSLVGATLALSEAGYEFRRYAGASAGAICATLLAALAAVARPVSDLTAILGTLDYRAFVAAGPAARAASGLRLLTRQGLYNGGYLRSWLGAQLADIGVTTFGDLAIDDDELPADHRSRLVVTVSDVTRGTSIRLPWDYPRYGVDPAAQLLVDAVRASMSIPFFFTPVRFKARSAQVSGIDLPAETCTWVDGGMLDNFPVDVFARSDRRAGRWPTIGVKLSAMGPPAARHVSGLFSEAKACLETLVDNADRFYVVPADAQRTIFVDHGDVGTTDFAITPAQQQMLLANGRAAATTFLQNRPAG
jgi:NTE family protein